MQKQKKLLYDFANLPIKLAEGVSLEELAEALNEPRILESKNVTVLEDEEMNQLANVVGERKKVFGARKDDDSKVDFVGKSAKIFKHTFLTLSPSITI